MAAKGIACEKKLSYTYCIVENGELNEGQCWEAIQFDAHRQLDHFILFIDDNKKQWGGYTIEVCKLFDLEAKFSSFGARTLKADGDSVESINTTVEIAKALKGKSIVIVLDTVKAQGIPHIEGMHSNHRLCLDDNDKAA